jgi:hypothetical protein
MARKNTVKFPHGSSMREKKKRTALKTQKTTLWRKKPPSTIHEFPDVFAAIKFSLTTNQVTECVYFFSQKKTKKGEIK